MFKLQQWANAAATLECYLSSQYPIHIVLITLLTVRIAASVSQRLHNLDATTSNIQRCSNVASTRDIKFSSRNTMNVALTTSLHRWNRGVSFTTSSQRRYNSDMFTTLCQGWLNVEYSKFVPPYIIDVLNATSMELFLKKVNGF